MKNPNDTQAAAPSDQLRPVAEGTDSDKKPDSSSESASGKKLEAQSISYRRSRDVALMKLALVPPGNNQPA
jgi:hypothetical protein